MVRWHTVWGDELGEEGGLEVPRGQEQRGPWRPGGPPSPPSRGCLVKFHGNLEEEKEGSRERPKGECLAESQSKPPARGWDFTSDAQRGAWPLRTGRRISGGHYQGGRLRPGMRTGDFVSVLNTGTPRLCYLGTNSGKT